MNLRQPHGSILINLIVIITIVAVLGAGMLYLTTTSTYASLFPNSQARAYYLAEAGIAHAQQLLAQNINNPSFYPGGKKGIDPPVTYTLANGDRFILTSYDFNNGGTPDPTRVVVEAVGVVHAGSWMESKKKVTKSGILRDDPNPVDPTPSNDTEEFIDFMVDDQVFVYGSAMSFSGNNVSGADATVVIRGPLDTDDINLGGSIAATTIYIDGHVELNKGSAGLGSSETPGNIYINGDLNLWNGSRSIYGDVYVNGNLRLKDAKIYGNIYVNGTVELGWTPTLSANTNIYYVGDGNPSTPDIIHPNYYNQSILNKCHKIPYGDVQTFPSFSMPDLAIPDPRSSAWFPPKGYVSSGQLASGLKIYTEGDYISSTWRPTANNVIIASKGNISITKMGGSALSGVLYAPYGKVTFEGGSFTGMVIARDGFFVTSGGTTVTFRGIENYIASADDYPFKPDQQIIQY